ncbi:MAG: hypothetical protein WCO77_00815 [bacterium]
MPENQSSDGDSAAPPAGTSVPLMARVINQGFVFLLAALCCAGCSTAPLDNARSHFIAGRLQEADHDLAILPHNGNSVLYLMERGMIRHHLRDYTNSTADWLEAVRLEKALEVHSVSRAGTSMIVNDAVLSFRGYPYEFTYLHAFLAQNFLAQGKWEDAAVEARNIAHRLEKLDEFPDDAFCRYLTGLCFELNGDESNAAMQYRQVLRLEPGSDLDATTGRFRSPTAPTNSFVAAPAEGELVCLLGFYGTFGMIPDHADIVIEGKTVGSSRTLVRRLQLECASSQRMAARHATKKLSRIVLKEAIAEAAETHNQNLGELLRVILFSMETNDNRRWETLPAKLAVARVPCPANGMRFDIEFKGASGTVLKRMTLSGPFMRKNKMSVAIASDNP